MNGIFVARFDPKIIEHMNKVTAEWTMQAARGECAWTCSDCSVNFPEGMPDKCMHEHQSCTDIIQRDKQEANTHK